MKMFVIEGGQPLRGTVRISGSKNACLPIMCAALLAEGKTVLENVPDIQDIRSMIYLLEHLNARITFKNNRMVIDSHGFDTNWVPYEMMRKMRASMYAFGPTIARLERAAVSKPGGCNIGSRPIDLHLRGFNALGVETVERKGYIHARHQGLKGADISLLGPNGTSVGATCNVLMAAALAEGTTHIRDAAREPEVQELARFLQAMGARIEGAGTPTITVHGVRQLSPVDWRVAADRIEAGTFAVAALITAGDIVLEEIEPHYMAATLAALKQWGADVEPLDDRRLRIRRGSRRGRAVRLTTQPYPGFPTDMQAAFVALLGLTPSLSVVRETIYPDRFMHVQELNRLGAKMNQRGEQVHIIGVDQYEGAALMASDLRAGAALVLAALAAQGESQVRRVYHLERGYERFDQKLASVGARIRVTDEIEEDPGLEDVWEENLRMEDEEDQIQTVSEAHEPAEPETRGKAREAESLT